MSKKILITSALPYVNNVPHLGNLVGAVLSADVYARFSRQMGYETLYICGSDEHGTATETKAKELGVTPKELCDKYHELHKKIYEWFTISFDIYGRTSEENHIEFTQELFTKVLDNKFIVEEVVTQPYSVESEMFLADRFVIGTCPHCSSEQATGDQCDTCGKLLTPQELINPKAKMDGSTPEFRKTSHLFLELDKLQPTLEKWFKDEAFAGTWSDNAISITQAWFKEGLKKRAISRDLKWGIPIPESAFNGKYKDKVFYVWFDAPMGYISITAQKKYQQDPSRKITIADWWQNENVELFQFMGKDNIPFHSIIFPASLMAASKDANNPDYHLVNHLCVTEYLNYENTKFSKSRNTGVFGDDAINSGIPADVYRYVLMFYRPENSDSQFTWKGVQERVNNELIGNFGNFVNRTLSFTNRFFEGKTIALDKASLDDSQKTFQTQIGNEIKVYTNLLKNVKLRDALMQLMKISSLCNQYFQASAPWKTRNENPQKAQTDLTLLVHAVKDLAIMCEPYMPTTSKNIFKQLNTKPENFAELGNLTLENHHIGEAKVLFTKIEDETVEELRGKFGGKQKKENKPSNKNKSKKKKEKKPITPLQPSDIQIIVGQITSIKQHPDADKLYIEEVDVGGKTIQIISGLVPYYKADELLNKKVFVVTNLKPAKMRGVMSHGMLLAAETQDESIVEVLDASNFKVGDSFSSSAKDEVDFGEFMTLSFTIANKEVSLNGDLFKIDGKQVLSEKVVNGLVR